MKSSDKNTQSDSVGWDRQWHLSTTAEETSLTEIEFALMRNYSAFNRWMDDCAACCHTSSHPCNGNDYAILNMIRMHHRPKSISEIARLTNRDDISNLQYSIKKLTRAGLIEKASSKENKRGTTYQPTEQGVKATDTYANFRREILLPLIQTIQRSGEKTDQVTRVLSLLSGIYDQASCIAAAHRVTLPNDAND